MVVLASEWGWFLREQRGGARGDVNVRIDILFIIVCASRQRGS